MTRKQEHNYDESKIKTLSSLEHIRLRTGMYIGRTGDGTQYEDGIYVLLKEVVDNAIDEFIMGFGARVEIAIEGQTVAVRDYGRGIPLGKLVECVSRINTGAKYNDDVFQFSVGLNGVGTKAVNALSAEFLVRSHREGAAVEAQFEKGILKRERKLSADGGKDGTFVRFRPDPEIFGAYAFDEELVARRLRFYAYLNAGLRIVCNGREILSEGGLLDLIGAESHYEKLYAPLHFRDKTLELALTHTNRFGEEYYSFVNGQFTTDGGTHLSAFREGLLRGINDFAKGDFEGEDVREGVLGAIAIKLKEPVFESQTKNKLGNAELRSPLVARVREIVCDLLHRDAAAAGRLLEKVEETRKLRTEMLAIKKMARERSKTVSIRIPQLKDCKVHRDPKRPKGPLSMLFITEGVSAAGPLTSCRDVNTQAVFTLKGKPLNTCDLQRDVLYRNVEIYNLVQSLNVEESVENLRYDRVILATDADVDGLHIRNLLITFFLRFYEPLVRGQHLQILETPLFKVRTRKETEYCYSEAERDAAVARLGKGNEITRFKGLGEISPGEFKNFIGEGMRLTNVPGSGEHSIPELLNFYMGKNTPERRDYIMRHLVVEESP